MPRRKGLQALTRSQLQWEKNGAYDNSLERFEKPISFA